MGAVLFISVMGSLTLLLSVVVFHLSSGCFGPPAPITTPAPTTTAAPLTNCKCGQANTVHKIVGGVDTEANEYPWQVGLIQSQFSSKPFCGGTLISDREILTAAHCGTSIGWVLLGEHDLTRADGEVRARVCSTTLHPQYSENPTPNNDLSILRLCDPVTFNRNIAPACLPSSSSNNYDNVAAVVSGWGTLSSGGRQPDVLQEVTVNTMTNGQCTSSPMKYPGSYITSNMMCAGGEGGKDSCQGDSGGPLVTKESSGAYSVIGVVSWGAGCADQGYPGVYARVTSGLDWINANKQGSSCPASKVFVIENTGEHYDNRGH